MSAALRLLNYFDQLRPQTHRGTFARFAQPWTTAESPTETQVAPPCSTQAAASAPSTSFGALLAGALGRTDLPGSKRESETGAQYLRLPACKKVHPARATPVSSLEQTTSRGGRGLGTPLRVNWVVTQALYPCYNPLVCSERPILTSFRPLHPAETMSTLSFLAVALLVLLVVDPAAAKNKPPVNDSLAPVTKVGTFKIASTAFVNSLLTTVRCSGVHVQHEALYAGCTRLASS